MRAQCCICSDLFENDDLINIAAAPCGHTFHEACLMKWLDTSATCPSCRKPCSRKHVIHKLFFDKDEVEETQEEDPTKLVNQVSDLRAKVRQKEKEKSDLLESKAVLQSRVQNIEIEKEMLEKKLKKEKTANTILTKQVSMCEAHIQSYKTEQHEYQRGMKQLKELKHLQTMLTGCESDALEILSQNGEGCTKQLSRYCAILKREYEQSKQEKKPLKDQIDKLRRDLVTKERLFREKSDVTEVLTEQLVRSEEDLKKTELERDLLREKLRHLRKAVRSPGDGAGSSSFIETLAEESPMNYGVTTPLGDSNNMNTSLIDKLSVTPDLFDSPATQTKRECVENGVKFIRISSASDNQKARRQQMDAQVTTDLKTLGSLNIFKKKSGVGNFNSAIQKGYNGLGGHTTFTKPLGTQTVRTSLSKKRKAPTCTGARKLAKNPPLPSLDNFIEID